MAKHTSRRDAVFAHGDARGELEDESTALRCDARGGTPGGGWARTLAAWGLIVLGGLASMATNLADDGDGSAGEESLVPCEAPADCEDVDSAPYCLERFGFCVQCMEDGHCDAQERCWEHACVTRCESNEACAADLVCVDGLCRACQVDTDCGDPNQYCYIGATFNACRPLCTDSSECTGAGYTEGDVCRGGRCQPVECTAPQDCLVDREVCDVQTGLCVPIVR